MHRLSALILVTLLLTGTARGQDSSPASIVFDGSLGSQGPAPYDEIGGARHYEISEDRGTYQGANLFHSFEQFSILTGDSATFTATLGAPERIIARVPDGDTSPIDGLLASSANGADLFLINSNGIALGPNASFDVSGSLYLSTAHVLRFEEGPDFATLGPNTTVPLEPPLLSSAPPWAFGFTDPSALSPVTLFLSSELRVNPGETLAFVGGNLPGPNEAGVLMLTFDGMLLDNVEAPGANVLLASAGGEVDIPLDLQGLDPASLSPDALGDVIIGNSVTIDVGDPRAGPSTGTIVIRGGNFLLENAAQLLASSIDVAVSDSAEIKTEAEVVGESIVISGREITISDFPESRTHPKGGKILGQFVSISGESIRVEGTDSLVGISTEIGPDGLLDIQAGTLMVMGGGLLQSLALDSDSGGDVVIRASEAVLVSGVGDSARSTIAARSAIGSTAIGGTISIETPILEALDGAVIEAVNAGLLGVPAGDEIPDGIQILASERILVEGGPNGASVIRSQSTGAGQGRGLSIQPIEESDLLSVELLNGGQVSVSTSGIGDAGALVLLADAVRIEGVDPKTGFNDSALFAQSNLELAESGDGGDITVTARELTVADYGRISVSTDGDGDAGTITLDVAETLMLSGPILDGRKGKVAASHGVDGALGAPGEIVITAGESVLLMGGARITAQSTGPAAAGSISIDAGGRFEASGFSVSDDGTTTRSGVTTASARSSGGQITIAASELVYLLDGEISTDVELGAGGGGNVVIGDPELGIPEFVVLNEGRISASAEEGAGGRIVIKTGTFFASAPFAINPGSPFPDSGSFLDATSGTPELTGTVDVEPPETELVTELAMLSASFLDASALLGSACEARTSRAGSFQVQRYAADLAPPDAALAPVGLHDAAPGVRVLPVGRDLCASPEETL